MVVTRTTRNWKPLMILVPVVITIPVDFNHPTGNGNTRSPWFSLMFTRGTTRLEDPDSGYPGYQVELGGFDVSRSRHHRDQSGSGSPWSSLILLRRTIPPEKPVSGCPGYQVQLGGTGVSRFNDREPSSSCSR